VRYSRNKKEGGEDGDDQNGGNNEKLRSPKATTSRKPMCGSSCVNITSKCKTQSKPRGDVLQSLRGSCHSLSIALKHINRYCTALLAERK